jgi:phosphoribosyl 1,2-cyclic phosphodiesterase
MRIRCWGSRGSIPVSGKEYLKYGGDTTCMEIRSKTGAVIVIDAGTGIRRLGNALVNEGITTIDMLFTHGHLDHLMGFPFFAPVFSKKCKITLRGSRLNKDSFRDTIAGFLVQPYFPVQIGDKDVKAKLTFKEVNGRPFTIGGITIHCIRLSHPRNGGLGYRFEEDGKSFVFLTDNELGYIHDGGMPFERYLEFSRGADLLIHDAEYTREDYQFIFKTSEHPWGHSLFTDAVKLGIEASVKKLGLFHINNRRTDQDVDEMVNESRRIIRNQKKKIDCFAVGHTFEMEL